MQENILSCAKEEFLQNGFERASIRTIAQKANTSTNSIYVRFGDKEGMYRAIVTPVAQSFLARLQKELSAFSELTAQAQEAQRGSYAEEKSNDLLDYIYQEFDAFKILITSGERNIYQEFLHQVVAVDVAATERFIVAIGNDAVTSGRLSSNYAHILSVAFYSGFFEIVVHDMPKAEAKDYIQRLRDFYNAGWSTIFEDAKKG